MLPATKGRPPVSTSAALRKWKRYGAATAVALVALLLTTSSVPAVTAGKPVVIANGWSSSDVGTAAPLAASIGGHVLFTGKDSLGRQTAEALSELQPRLVIVLGGTKAVTATVEDQILDALPDIKIERLAGSNRIDTAAKAALYVAGDNGRSSSSSPTSTDYEALKQKLDRLETRIKTLESTGSQSSNTQQAKLNCLGNHYHTLQPNSFASAFDHSHTVPSHDHGGFWWSASTGEASWSYWTANDETSKAKFDFNATLLGCP